MANFTAVCALKTTLALVRRCMKIEGWKIALSNENTMVLSQLNKSNGKPMVLYKLTTGLRAQPLWGWKNTCLSVELIKKSWRKKTRPGACALMFSNKNCLAATGGDELSLLSENPTHTTRHSHLVTAKHRWRRIKPRPRMSILPLEDWNPKSSGKTNEIWTIAILSVSMSEAYI